MPTFRNCNSGQVVQVDDDPSHLSDLARWERIEEGLSAPAELTHTPSSDVTSEVGGHTVEPTTTDGLESAEAAIESAEAKVADATVAAEDAQTALEEAHEDATAQVQELSGELADTLPAATQNDPTGLPTPSRTARPRTTSRACRPRRSRLGSCRPSDRKAVTDGHSGSRNA